MLAGITPRRATDRYTDLNVINLIRETCLGFCTEITNNYQAKMASEKDVNSSNQWKKTGKLYRVAILI